MLKKELKLLKKSEIVRFHKKILNWYEGNQRHSLTWRKKITPYRILVSEIMLQQTQVPRVLSKFTEFLTSFPSVSALADAPLSEVLRAWSGLGYNRRAKFLHLAAKEIQQTFHGKFPTDEPTLRTLPGIGAYTAAALMTFAYNKPAVLIETNIRTVYIHEFFSKGCAEGKKIDDKELSEIVKTTQPSPEIMSPREWYWALMDYGTFLKSTGSVAHRQSKSFQKQSPFKGSRREVRGAILKALKSSARVKIPEIQNQFAGHQHDVSGVIEDLIAEGLVKRTAAFLRLP